MIKKIIGFFGIVGLGLSFVSADDSVSLPYSFYINNVSNTVTTDLNFQNANGSKFLYGHANGGNEGNYYAIFWNGRKLYSYSYYQYFNDYIQGYFEKSCKVSSSTGLLELPVCVSENDFTENNAQEFYNLSSVNFTRGYFSFYGDTAHPFICFYNANNHYYYCFQGNYVTGSIGIPRGTTDFITYAGYSQFSSVPINDNNNIYCPTVSQLIDNYNRGGFNSGMCYTSTKIFNGSTFVNVESKSIFDLYSSSEEYVNDCYKYGQYCESSVYNSNVCYEAFSGDDLKFNLISKLPNDINFLGGRKQLYKYCDLYNYDPNTTTCVGSGLVGDIGTEISYSDVTNSISNGNYKIVSPTTGTGEYQTVYSMNSGSNYSGDVISNIQHIFTKITSIFKLQTGNTSGSLPNYIIYPLIIIILYKLFKK